ncbi:MAG: hypothetical protein KAU14_01825 [Thermoplasmata archaeon]|nr:hypothetical protein [Thermoplasmata archaeon]
MKFTEQNSVYEFSKLMQCIETTKRHGEISLDDAETLTFFLELVKKALTSRSISNA